MQEFPKLSGYRLLRELGHGGMATVYLAVQESLEREVAIKVMAAALAADRSFSERFLKEARTAARLQHPGIVAIYDTGVVGHHHYIAMELVAGGELKDRLRGGALAPEQAVRLTTQIAEALAYAHDKGFVHRDVKPENILFRENGHAVLTDFGIARSMGSGTRMTGTGMSIGTPHYMSPEQARGRDVDGRSDLYALGVLFYEVLTGKVPFDAQDSFAVGLMHISEAPPELPDHLARYQPVLDRLLAKEPDERYQNGQALIQALAEAEHAPAPKRPERAATRVVPITPAESASSPKGNPTAGKRNTGPLWAAGGAVLAAVLAIGVWSITRNDPRPVPGGGSSAPIARSTPPARSGDTRPPDTARQSSVAAPAASAPDRRRQPGDVFHDCPDCPELVVIPAGRFTMGSPSNEPQRGSQEGPQRTVNVPSFALGTKEVTFEQWDACVADGGCSHRPNDWGWGRGNRPVINVSWNDAQEYVRWLSRKTGEDYRLPSESEWEYAARAGTTTRFHTGNCITTDQANFDGNYPAEGCPRGEYRERTVPVGSFAPNAFGLHDMHGNVWEWVQDCWSGSYNGAPSDGSAWMSGDCGRAVLRGGSWVTSGHSVLSAYRSSFTRGARNSTYGFRVARSVSL